MDKGNSGDPANLNSGAFGGPAGVEGTHSEGTIDLNTNNFAAPNPERGSFDNTAITMQGLQVVPRALGQNALNHVRNPLERARMTSPEGTTEFAPVSGENYNNQLNRPVANYPIAEPGQPAPNYPVGQDNVLDRDLDPASITDNGGITKGGYAAINKIINSMDENLAEAVDQLRDLSFTNVSKYSNRGQEFRLAMGGNLGNARPAKPMTTASAAPSTNPTEMPRA